MSTPAAHDTFFCFAVRRGARLYLLDDAPEYAHPLESQMSRSPGRRLAERPANLFFITGSIVKESPVRWLARPGRRRLQRPVAGRGPRTVRHRSAARMTAGALLVATSWACGDGEAAEGSGAPTRLTATVRRGDLVIRAEATGTVEQVNVQVGDQVEPGQKLAELSQTSLPQNIILAQADLVAAQRPAPDALEP